MHAYIAVRSEGESLIQANRLTATILRPWYVLGEGHRWAYALIPFYAVARQVPAWRARAERLGLVTHEQMVRALVAAVESPAQGVRIVEVPEIRKGFGAATMTPLRGRHDETTTRRDDVR